MFGEYKTSTDIDTAIKFLSGFIERFSTESSDPFAVDLACGVLKDFGYDSQADSLGHGGAKPLGRRDVGLAVFGKALQARRDPKSVEKNNSQLTSEQRIALSSAVDRLTNLISKR